MQQREEEREREHDARIDPRHRQTPASWVWMFDLCSGEGFPSLNSVFRLTHTDLMKLTRPETTTTKINNHCWWSPRHEFRTSAFFHHHSNNAVLQRGYELVFFYPGQTNRRFGRINGDDEAKAHRLEQQQLSFFFFCVSSSAPLISISFGVGHEYYASLIQTANTCTWGIELASLKLR